MIRVEAPRVRRPPDSFSPFLSWNSSRKGRLFSWKSRAGSPPRWGNARTATPLIVPRVHRLDHHSYVAFQSPKPLTSSLTLFLSLSLPLFLFLCFLTHPRSRRRASMGELHSVLSRSYRSFLFETNHIHLAVPNYFSRCWPSSTFYFFSLLLLRYTEPRAQWAFSKRGI